MSIARQIPERDQLLKAVDEIAPVVRQHADRAESLGHLPMEIVEALDHAEIFSMMWPRELGGYEADPVTQHEVIDRLAYHDASTAWCAFIGAGSGGFIAANMPEEGYQEMQAAVPPERHARWLRLAGSPQPVGRAVSVDGGYRISGRWGWASGVHHADWVYVGAVLLDGGEPRMTDLGIPDALSFVMPKSDMVVEDTWHTAGLSGTGSTHLSVDDLFVPSHRTIPFPLTVPQRGGALYRLPVLGFFGPAFSGFPQGVGRRALDEIKTLAATKERVMAGRVLSERGVFQRDLALAHDRLRAMGLLVRDGLARLWQDLHDDATPDGVSSAELLSSFSQNGDAAVAAVEMAYQYGGGDSVFRTNLLQRQLRDMRVAAQHMLIGEHNYESLGKALLEAHSAR